MADFSLGNCTDFTPCVWVCQFTLHGENVKSIPNGNEDIFSVVKHEYENSESLSLKNKRI